MKILLAFIFLLSISSSHVDAQTIPQPIQLMKICLDFIEAEGRNSTEYCVVKGPGIFTPVGVARAISGMSTSLFNVWSRCTTDITSTVDLSSVNRRTCTEKELGEALNWASYFYLKFLLPSRSDESLDGIMAGLGFSTSDKTSEIAKMAKAVIDIQSQEMLNDGMNQQGCYSDITNFTIPKPLNTTTREQVEGFQTQNIYSWVDIVNRNQKRLRPFLTPQAASSKSFSKLDLMSLLPKDFPLSPAEYDRQMREVISYQSRNDIHTKLVAEFWADGPLTTLPPGHWTEITISVCRQLNYTTVQQIKLLFLVGTGLFDSGIACWHQKRFFSSVRPATWIPTQYINETLANQFTSPYCGNRDILGWQWSPYQAPAFATPPFSEFPSGHSTFSRSSAELLAKFTGSPKFPIPLSYEIPPGGSLFEFHCFKNNTNLRGKPCVYTVCFDNSTKDSENSYIPTEKHIVGPFQNFRDAADEAGISRLYGGIHISAGDLGGRKIGAAVAEAVFARACELMNGNCLAEGSLPSHQPSSIPIPSSNPCPPIKSCNCHVSSMSHSIQVPFSLFGLLMTLIGYLVFV